MIKRPYTRLTKQQRDAIEEWYEARLRNGYQKTLASRIGVSEARVNAEIRKLRKRWL